MDRNVTIIISATVHLFWIIRVMAHGLDSRLPVMNYSEYVGNVGYFCFIFHKKSSNVFINSYSSFSIFENEVRHWQWLTCWKSYIQCLINLDSELEYLYYLRIPLMRSWTSTMVEVYQQIINPELVSKQNQLQSQ